MNHHHHHHYYSYADPKQQLPPICTSTIPSSNNASPAVMGLPNFSTPFIGPSSSFPSYPSSVPSCFPANVPPLFSPTSDDLSDGALIGAFAARDLQIPNGRQALGDNSSQDGGRIGRYSAEERKERIERYRSKRNQRNFQKKITYACRKTLADSRPRVKGRFARNGEIETETAESSADCDDYSYYNNESSWKLEGGDLVKEEDACRYEEEDDDEMWASFLNGISMNLPS